MKNIILLLIFLLGFCEPASGAMVTGQESLAVAERLYDDAASDKYPPATIVELDRILDLLNRAMLDTNQGVREKATVLILKVSEMKYSRLEGPSFANNKGGPEVLFQAKKIAIAALEKTPDDLELLSELYQIRGLLNEEAEATLEKMLKLAPNKASFQSIASWYYARRRKFPKAVDHLAAAIRLEKRRDAQIEYMSDGVSLAHDAHCEFADALNALYKEIPDSARNSEVEGGLAVAKEQHLEFKKIKRKYLKMFKSTNCQLNGK